MVNPSKACIIQPKKYHHLTPFQENLSIAGSKQATRGSLHHGLGFSKAQDLANLGAGLSNSREKLNGFPRLSGFFERLSGFPRIGKNADSLSNFGIIKRLRTTFHRLRISRLQVTFSSLAKKQDYSHDKPPSVTIADPYSRQHGAMKPNSHHCQPDPKRS